MTADLLAAAVTPPLSWRQFGSTRIDVFAVLILAAALLYWLGVRQFGRLHPNTSWSMRRTAAFYGGLLVALVALESVIGVYDQILFYDHMIQHLMLIMVAAPLLAMGAPVELLERATTGKTHRIVERGLGSRIAEAVGHPVVDFVLYAVLVPIAHLTSFYNDSLTRPAVNDLEHVLFLAIGYLFWRHVVAIEPSRHPLSPPLRLVYLALAVPVDTFTGLTLASATTELFPAYLAIHRTWGPSLITDLHAGGAIMWVAGDTLMLIAMIPCAIQWMRYEEARAIEIDRELDLATQQRSSQLGPMSPEGEPDRDE